MNSAARNPRVGEMRQSVRSSYEALNALLDGPLTTIDQTKLYYAPASDEWTLMENIAHVIEFMPYWADEVVKLVDNPGQNFGRTMRHEGRLRFIAEHRTDSLQQARSLLPGSYARLERTFDALQDSDLEVTGHHSTLGEHDLAWFINEFIVQHLSSHVEQIKQALTLLETKT